MLISVTGKACDMCGIFMGITPYDNQSSIGIYYRYRAFNGYDITANSGQFLPDGNLRGAQGSPSVNHNTDVNHVYSEKDYEVYRTLECRAKYYIHQRIELNCIVPYKMNSQMMNVTETQVGGIGDINFYAGYHLFRKVDVEKTQHDLIFGAGVSTASGDYMIKVNDKRADALIQPGTGTTDGFIYSTYIFGFKKFGFNATATYKINGTNSLNEHIANSSTLNASLFYKLNVNDNGFTLIPKALLYYEYTNGLFVDATYVEGTKMNVMMLGTGIDIFIKNFSVNFTIDLPVYENQEPEALVNSGRYSIGLTYNLNQKKYLLK